MSRKIIDKPRLCVSGLFAEVCKVLTWLSNRLAFCSTSVGSSLISSGLASHLHETKTEGIPAALIASEHIASQHKLLGTAGGAQYLAVRSTYSTSPARSPSCWRL